MLPSVLLPDRAGAHRTQGDRSPAHRAGKPAALRSVPHLRLKQRAPPSRWVALKQSPNVDAASPEFKKLDPRRNHAVRAPVVRTRNVYIREAATSIREALLESRRIQHWGTLLRSPGRDLGLSRPGSEQRVRGGVGQALRAADDTHLALDVVPPEGQPHMRIRCQRPCLG